MARMSGRLVDTSGRISVRTQPQRALARITITLAFLWCSAAALAQPAATAPDLSDFSPPKPTCIEWTNSCRLCKLSDAGTPACSNVGIACQPQLLRCTRYKEESKDEKKEEKK